MSVLGRNEEAIKDYTKAIEINPQDHEVYFNMGYYYVYYLNGFVLSKLGRKNRRLKIIPKLFNRIQNILMLIIEVNII